MKGFTSEDCRSVVKTCVQCGAEFSSYASRNQKFCSPGCAYKNPARLEAVASKQRKDRGVAICAGCGIEFKIVTRGGTKYCTHKCATSSIGKRTMMLNRRKVPVTKKVERPCNNCGKMFSSWESSNRKFCDSKCAGMSPDRIASQVRAFRKSGWAKGNTYSRSVKQWLRFGKKKIYCRSLWEANYARYLEWMKVRGEIQEWEHEPETFWFNGIKRGVMSYLPDFKVMLIGGGHEWHEVKGWMDSKSITKLKRMKKYFPQETVKVFGQDWFSAAAKNLASIVPGWERKKK